MSALSIPNSFVNGTVINSSPFNANFSAIVTWSTAVDNTNIGPAGLFASQLLPLTGAQATFGLTATGVGYKFLANDATAVPLTVSGVSGQSVDLFDVTLTSGGAKALAVSNIGTLTLALSTGATALSFSGTGTNTITSAAMVGGLTAFKFNATDATMNGPIADFQLAGTSKFKVDFQGVGTFAGALAIGGALSGVTTIAGSGLASLQTITLGNAVAPTVAAGFVGLGSQTAASATGGAATLPASPVAFLVINVGGTNYKIPYYAS